MEAASNGAAKVARYLAARESRLTDSYGVTALMLASAHNHPETTLTLADREALMSLRRPKFECPVGSVAQQIALRSGNLEIARFLVPYESKVTHIDENFLDKVETGGNELI